MSHFTVLVIGDNPETQLAPFHEFECTGLEIHIQEIDTTEESRSDFDSFTHSMVKVPEGANVPTTTRGYTVHPEHGVIVSRHDDFFKVPNPEKETPFSQSTVFQLPEGFTEISVPGKELGSFTQHVIDYLEIPCVAAGETPALEGPHKYGYAQLDEKGEVIKTVRRTNPNAHWDWYVLGGRWTGFFAMKAGAEGELGEQSFLGSAAEPGKADAARKGDIDFDAMRAEARATGEQQYDAFINAIEGMERPLSFPEVRALHPDDIKAAREAYNDQPAIVALNKLPFSGFQCPVATYGWDRDAYLNGLERGAISTYAVIKDGEWIARGQMGWFGMSDDKLSEDEWQQRYADLIDSLPDDTLLSVYDCHI